jgi:hypothetical protein
MLRADFLARIPVSLALNQTFVSEEYQSSSGDHYHRERDKGSTCLSFEVRITTCRVNTATVDIN